MRHSWTQTRSRGVERIVSCKERRVVRISRRPVHIMRTPATIILGFLVLQLLPRFSQGLRLLSPQQKSSLSPFEKLGNRRAVLQKFAAGALGLGSSITFGGNPPVVADDNVNVATIPIKPSFNVYQVKTDATASLDPSLNPFSVRSPIVTLLSI